jgi:glycogen(starch) synthase
VRILFWSETFWPRVGGVENLAASLLPALRTRGHEFAVITWEHTKNPDKIDYDGTPVYRFPFFSGGGEGGLGPVMDHLHRVSQLKREFAPDLVHVNSYGRSVLFHLTANAHPTPMLVTLHQQLPDELVGRDTLVRKILHAADWVTACSESVLAHARRLMPEIVPCSSVIYNGIAGPTFAPRPIPFDPPRLLCLGRLVAEKGFDLALSAFAIVLARFPGARLVIAGDGSERERLQQQMIALGLGDSVEFIGQVAPETVAHLIDQSTLVVIPSRLEGFSLVALEAAWMGRPVVAARIGGLPEVVVHEHTGLLVESGNGEALAEAIAFLIEDPERARRMGQAARSRAEEVFSWQHHVNAYDALYRKLTAAAKPEAMGIF